MHSCSSCICTIKQSEHSINSSLLDLEYENLRKGYILTSSPFSDCLSVRAIQIYMMTFARKRLLTESSIGVSIQRHDELWDILMSPKWWWIAHKKMTSNRPAKSQNPKNSCLITHVSIVDRETRHTNLRAALLYLNVFWQFNYILPQSRSEISISNLIPAIVLRDEQ